MTTETLSDTIMAIYDSALATDGWFKALRRIADFSGSAGCRIIVEQNIGAPMILSVQEGSGYESAGKSIELGGITASAEQAALVLAGELLVRSQMASEAASVGSAEAWHTDDIGDVLTVVLLGSNCGSIVLEAIKTKQQGIYSEAELARMRMITSHLAKAIRISDSLSVSRLTSELLETGLEALSTGVYFISRRSRRRLSEPAGPRTGQVRQGASACRRSPGCDRPWFAKAAAGRV